ncbi:polysaccharide deacetylase family protein, partial [Herbiconiux sp. YIM B11900]|uniref:polysaccharide deacetylase family protein n=1 Tax=Herbiconiux sp. YIM B11900 TaxID=3404131 RepID=UPI003F829406
MTFDDGNADQLAAAATLDAKGLKGTFYVPSGYIGQPNYMTLANLNTIAAAGHEIGGHTVHHQNLPTLSSDDVKREICNDRVNLVNWGFAVTSFAYPFAAVNASVEAAAGECGYNSARGLGDLRTGPTGGCPDCDFAETIPPADSLLTRAADQVERSSTLADLQARVTDAQNNGGGWVQLTFHHVCDGCENGPDDPTMSPALFDEFTTWLAAWQAGGNGTVQTVNAVIGGPMKPVVPGPALAPPPGPGENGTQNPGLETPGAAANIPQCWWGSSFGTNTATFTTVTPGHTGAAAAKVTVTNYVNGDAKLLALFDESGCAPSVTPGATYSLRAFYTSTANTQFAIYTRNTLGVWTYWTSGPLYLPASTYTQVEYTTPPIPADVTGISFGLNLAANGELVTDDYAIYNSNGAPLLALSPAAPTVAGSAQVGQTLTATIAPWAPQPVSMTYQWKADGVAITGANNLTYSPLPADVGKTLTFTATGTKPGYETLSVVSAPTGAVAAASITTTRIGGADRF